MKKLISAAEAAGMVKDGMTVMIGGFLGNAYDRSELYNPTFAHGFREADPTKLDVKPEVK